MIHVLIGIDIVEVVVLYSCFNKGCPKQGVKVYATMPKGSLENTQ